jgi:hypothetical protein
VGQVLKHVGTPCLACEEVRKGDQAHTRRKNSTVGAPVGLDWSGTGWSHDAVLVLWKVVGGKG